jgi:hypothetical protein
VFTEEDITHKPVTAADRERYLAAKAAPPPVAAGAPR